MHKTIIMAGNMLIDIIYEIDRYPQKGMLSSILQTAYCVGGAVSNTGIDLKRLDQSLSIQAIGKIGDDEYGRRLLQIYQQNGLDCSNIMVDATTDTSFTCVMAEKGKERTFFHLKGANQKLKYEDFHTDTYQAELFHLGYALLLDSLEEMDCEYGNKMARLLHDVQQRGIQTSLDVVSENSDRFRHVILPCLPYLDYFILNEIEAGMICNLEPRDEHGKLNLENLQKILLHLKEKGIRKKVIIHCPELGISINERQEITMLPSFSLPNGYIVGTVGAGDAFCAGALYGILNQQSDMEILKIASCCATCNLASENAIDGAKSITDTLKIESLFQRRKISL